MLKEILLNHTPNSNTQDVVTQQELLFKNVSLPLSTENTVLLLQVDVVQLQPLFTLLKPEITLLFVMTSTEELKDI